MRDYLEVAVEAAKLGGEVLKQSYGQVKEIEYKGEINIVTNVDKRSEKLIVELLNSRFPKHSILAEEGTDMVKPSEYKWDDRPAGRHHKLCARLSNFLRFCRPGKERGDDCGRRLPTHLRRVVCR